MTTREHELARLKKAIADRIRNRNPEKIADRPQTFTREDGSAELQFGVVDGRLEVKVTKGGDGEPTLYSDDDEFLPKLRELLARYGLAF